MLNGGITLASEQSCVSNAYSLLSQKLSPKCSNVQHFYCITLTSGLQNDSGISDKIFAQTEDFKLVELTNSLLILP